MWGIKSRIKKYPKPTSVDTINGCLKKSTKDCLTVIKVAVNKQYTAKSTNELMEKKSLITDKVYEQRSLQKKKPNNSLQIGLKSPN